MCHTCRLRLSVRNETSPFEGLRAATIARRKPTLRFEMSAFSIVLYEETRRANEDQNVSRKPRLTTIHDAQGVYRVRGGTSAGSPRGKEDRTNARHSAGMNGTTGVRVSLQKTIKKKDIIHDRAVYETRRSYVVNAWADRCPLISSAARPTTENCSLPTGRRVHRLF